MTGTGDSMKEERDSVRNIPVVIFLIILVIMIFNLEGGQEAFGGARGGGRGSGLAISSTGRAGIEVSNGLTRRTLDFEEDISGCMDTYDPATGETDEVPAEIRVAHSAFRKGKYYLLLIASATANCNIQGLCGAGKDHTALWVKLDRDLRLEDKKAAVIGACQAGITIFDPYLDATGDIPSMKAEDGMLVIDFGNTRGNEEEDIYYRLSYDTSHPERGALITARVKEAEE